MAKNENSVNMASVFAMLMQQQQQQGALLTQLLERQTASNVAQTKLMAMANADQSGAPAEKEVVNSLFAKRDADNIGKLPPITCIVDGKPDFFVAKVVPFNWHKDTGKVDARNRPISKVMGPCDREDVDIDVSNTLLSLLSIGRIGRFGKETILSVKATDERGEDRLEDCLKAVQTFEGIIKGIIALKAKTAVDAAMDAAHVENSAAPAAAVERKVETE